MVWGSIARYYYKIMWYGMVQFSYLVFQNVKITWFSHILKVYLLFGIRIILRYPGNILASSQNLFREKNQAWIQFWYQSNTFMSDNVSVSI